MKAIIQSFDARNRRGLHKVFGCFAIALAILCSGARANAVTYPLCQPQPQEGTTCPMKDTNSGPVMHGETFAGIPNTVPIYVILYGPWAGTVNSAMYGAVENLFLAMNDTVYSALIGSYSDASGPAAETPLLYSIWQDTAKSQGNTLTVASIHQEIATAISQAPFPSDPNGIYVLLPDNTITVTTDCGSYCHNGSGYVCGCNTQASISGTTLNYVVVGDSVGCPGTGGNGCTWGFLTPNNANGADTNGAIDAELNFIAHEVAERITDPKSTGGWTTTNGDQMADLCQLGRSVSTAEGSVYTVQTSAGAATANFHAAGNDFLIQTLRANESPSPSNGYCANSYGGVFWGMNFGYTWSPTSPQDWDPGNYKGECASEQPMIGLSQYTTGSGIAHAVFCGSGANGPDYYQSSSGCGTITMSQEYNDGDWDPGFTLGECEESQFVAGVSQGTAGEIAGLLCCAAPSYIGSVRHLDCERQLLNSSNVASYDWDFNYYKAQCNAGQYVAGVSAASATSGAPHAIYCCNP